MTSKEFVSKAAAPPGTSSSSSSSSRVPSPWHGRRLSSSASNSPAAAGTPTGSALSMTPSPHLRATQHPPSIVTSEMSRLGSSSSPRSFSPIHPEPDKRGNLEYKLRILPVTAGRFSRLVTQLKWRLAEGNGLAVYEIGVLDDGTLIGLPKEEMKNSLTQLAMMGKALGASCEIRRCIVVQRGEVPEQADDGLQALDESATADTQLHTFRHRKAYSSKTQSAGLDNIVGLTSLNNEDAAKLLGTTQGSTSAWSLDITTSDSETEGYDDDEDEDGGQPSQHGHRPLSGSDSEDATDDNDSEEDEDGFAFSLSLDDNEDEVTPLPVPTTARPRRASRPAVSNSPWKLSTPDCSPSGSRQSLSARHSQTTTGTGGAPTAGPTSFRSTPAVTPSSVDADDGDGHHFTELAGMDVKGVLQFALDPELPAIGLNTKRKKKSGRRKREDRQHNMAMLVSSGQCSNAAAPNDDDIEVDPFAPIQALGFTAEEVSNLSHPKVRRATKISKRFSREPRAERRARRLAELKAQEREGEGLLIALDADPALSKQDRAQWWKYSGLTFEDHLPHWDSTRQGWVREVADFLTVKEMMTLADSWDPAAPLHEGGDDGEGIDGEDQSPPSSTPPVASASNGGRKTGQTIQQYLDAQAAAAANLQASVSRKANCRRRRKERRRAAAAERDGGALCRLDGRSPRPTFLPPPSNGVAIPSRRASVAGTSTGSHPLSTSQTIDEDEDDDEDDNFSMGLTLNIDDEDGEKSNRALNGAGKSASHVHSPLSVSSSSSAATAATIIANPTAGNTGLPLAGRDILQNPEVRIIVEAVLSLDSARGSVTVAGTDDAMPPPDDGEGADGDGDALSAVKDAVEDVAPDEEGSDSDADSDFGVWEL